MEFRLGVIALPEEPEEERGRSGSIKTAIVKAQSNLGHKPSLPNLHRSHPAPDAKPLRMYVSRRTVKSIPTVASGQFFPCSRARTALPGFLLNHPTLGSRSVSDYAGL